MQTAERLCTQSLLMERCLAAFRPRDFVDGIPGTTPARSLSQSKEAGPHYLVSEST